MAMNYTLTSGTTTNTILPVTWTGSGGGYTQGVTYISSGSGGWTAPAPRTPTALEWLDAEVEKVCKLARLAG